MINITKSIPPPACLEQEKEKASGKYNCGDVLERLQKDFHNKCYICESKAITSINVEHFIPHKGNKNLKFDWENLFFSCGHCNNTKLDNYEDILNCTNPEHDVVNWIKYELEPFPKGKAKITPEKKNDPLVQNTVQLLNAVYNGTTPLKEMESENLRELLREEYLDFQRQLDSYYSTQNDEEKTSYRRIIIEQLEKSSPYTAFKRWIIKENEVLKNDFEKAFD